MVMTANEPTATYPAGDADPVLAAGPDVSQLRLRLWTAPASRGTAALTATQIAGVDTAWAPDVVALSIDQEAVAAGPAVLVMTRPNITSASITLAAMPRPDGSIQPIVRELPLTNGVAHYTAETDAFIPRLTVNNVQGTPAGVGPGWGRCR